MVINMLKKIMNMKKESFYMLIGVMILTVSTIGLSHATIFEIKNVKLDDTNRTGNIEVTYKNNLTKIVEVDSKKLSDK